MALIDLLLFLQSAGILFVFFLIAWLRRDREYPRGSSVVGKSIARLHLWGDLLTVTSEPVRVVPCLMRCREEAQ